MLKLFKRQSLFVLLVLSILLGSLSLATAYSHQDFGQENVPVDLSGEYDGRVYFADKTGGQYLLNGPVKLKVSGLAFTFKDATGKELKGQLRTFLRPRQDNLGVGQIQLDNETAPIEIRWYRDKDRKILKLVRARGANRVFRFCSANLTKAQCKGRV